MKIKKYITFPEDYYHFGNGAKIEDEQIDDWVDEIVDYLMRENDYYSFRASGDTIAIGFKKEGEIEIYVCKNYSTLNFDEEDLIKSSSPRENE